MMKNKIFSILFKHSLSGKLLKMNKKPETWIPVLLLPEESNILKFCLMKIEVKSVLNLMFLVGMF